MIPAEFVKFATKTIIMPTIFIVFGFIFKFYSDDHEPIHVHIIKDSNEAKYNVEAEYFKTASKNTR